ncbi:MAG: SET domain-containing protein-lysine N-methyltransferase, partial [Burkholderiaceae bacterium]|nr:SET domain-containing protein-lysine N-methyltransferase [Burkholderiaceae bacterium]
MNFHWLHPDLVERPSSSGTGTFAHAAIRKGQLVAVFGGYVLELDDEIDDHGIQITPNLVIAPMVKGGVRGDFINHSCDPNCGIRGQITLFALRDIDFGEEITFDYGSVLFSSQKKDRFEMVCKCGAESCRKLITSEDWRMPDLQARLGSHFSFHILEKIYSR